MNLLFIPIKCKIVMNYYYTNASVITNKLALLRNKLII